MLFNLDSVLLFVHQVLNYITLCRSMEKGLACFSCCRTFENSKPILIQTLEE